ncbi:hypothetical protein A3C17_01305 [Candidatus Uhrbacteria bacterium RIFCSPHIGHO2_02_FULL_53_13]|uniref:Transcription elongation factor GreA n=2 Tax=Candidatus Uhriibacteriota TaxID=1752732 RepID=A0A1F7TYR0_9BACT|nr:MAG: hypothetical protein A3C17_01305 [Candidatus Uhrbacteria bacterium RIFCSPHIGHO2_02_FULL_53_13]OGL90048.1 MAG: hypothetical protein A3I45_04430 [Candidatus Uhrbacteria bacterium RIFCSPLOWO2_02_FULL_53_10]
MPETQYMSQEKLNELNEELSHRKTTVRKEIGEALEYAKQLGDLSENFEYHDAKDRQADNEKRIAELQAIVLNAQVITKQKGGSSIEIGTTFRAEKDGKEFTFTLVGSNEANPVEGKISNESPIGKAFLGASIDERVIVDTPSGAVQYIVTAIE